jgi:Fe-S cluster assembly protein SufD
VGPRRVGGGGLTGATDMGQDHRTRYQDLFVAFERTLNGDANSPVHALRRTGMGHFQANGFPTTSQEEWRFTNVQSIADRPFVPSLSPSPSELTAADIERLTVPARDRFVFINGHYRPALSSASVPSGVRALSLAEARSTDRAAVERHLARTIKGTESAFTALNTSFLMDGLFLHVPAGIEIAEPIVLVYVTDRTAGDLVVHPRNLIVLEERAAAKVVEFYVTNDGAGYLTNAVTEVVLGKRARLEHDKVQVEALSAFHLAATHVAQSVESVYRSNNFALGGSIVRNELTSVLQGDRCECTLNGLSLGTGEQLIDNHTTIDHAMPNGNSWEVYKAVLAGRSRGVFNGKIYVRQDAQKTDAKQTNKTLLLSDEATIDTKPQLEIFADDVKCTHGATVGQLDEQQVFYLRSRGIAEHDARDILTFAFADEVVGHVSIEAVRDRLEQIIHQRLDEGRKA